MAVGALSGSCRKYEKKGLGSTGVYRSMFDDDFEKTGNAISSVHIHSNISLVEQNFHFPKIEKSCDFQGS